MIRHVAPLLYMSSGGRFKPQYISFEAGAGLHTFLGCIADKVCFFSKHSTVSPDEPEPRFLLAPAGNGNESRPARSDCVPAPSDIFEGVTTLDTLKLPYLHFFLARRQRHVLSVQATDVTDLAIRTRDTCARVSVVVACAPSPKMHTITLTKPGVLSCHLLTS